MDILQKQHGTKGSFYVQPDGEILEEMTYSMTNDSLMIINHKLRGKNVGYLLVKKAANYAGKHHINIIPRSVLLPNQYLIKKEMNLKMY